MEIFVAVGKNFEIGKNNQLPWNTIKEDMVRFKNQTIGCDEKNINAVIMGRKTWESIPSKFRPLKNRINIVLSKNENYLLEYANKNENDLHKVFTSLNESIKYLMNIPNLQKTFVIGGSHLYNEVLESDIVSYIHITKIEKEYDADTYFPNILECKDKLLISGKLFNEELIEKIERDNEPNLLFLKYSKVNIEENKYLNVLKDLIENGEERNDRT